MTDYRMFSLYSAQIIASFALIASVNIASANEQRVYPRSCETYICVYHHQYTPQQYAPQSQTRRHLPSKIILPTMPESVYPSLKSIPKYMPQSKPFKLNIETDMLVSFEPDPIPTPDIVPKPAPLEITDEYVAEPSDESTSKPTNESAGESINEPVAKSAHKPKIMQKSKSMPKVFGIGVGSGVAKAYPCNSSECISSIKPYDETDSLKSKPQPKSWINEMQLDDVPRGF